MHGARVSYYRYRPFLTVIAAVALILLGIGAAYMVWMNMLRDQERLNPSTERVLVTTDGQRVPLTQPSPTAPQQKPRRLPQAGCRSRPKRRSHRRRTLFSCRQSA